MSESQQVEVKPKPAELWLQTFRFWRCARNIRHGYIDPADNTRKQLTKEQKLEDIAFWVDSAVWRPSILRRFEELKQEVLDNKEYKQNESQPQAKTAS